MLAGVEINKSLVRAFRRSISLVAVLSISMSVNVSFAAGESEYQQAVSEYKNRKFSQAAELFWKSITAGNSSPHAWLYMGHAYAAAGDKEKALDTYKEVGKIFAGQPAAKMAAAGIKNLGRVSSRSSTSSSSSRTSTSSNSSRTSTSAAATTHSNTGTANRTRPKTTNTDDWRSVPFQERVIVYPPSPKFGHPAVTKTSEAAIISAIRRLPSHIYKKLDENGVTVTLAPNIIDKWPDMVKNDTLDKAARDLASERGRCYGRDVHVWQHSIARNSLAVGATRSTGVMVDAFLHEIGHAFDECSGKYSSSSDVLEMHDQDVKDMPVAVRSKLNYYTQYGAKGCAEACAELFSAVLGSRSEDAVMCTNYFKRLRRFIEKKSSRAESK